MGRFNEDAKELLEEKIPLDLSNALAVAPYVTLQFKYITGAVVGTISGKAEVDAVGLGWIYIDLPIKSHVGGHMRVVYTKSMKWKVMPDKSVWIKDGL